MIVALIGKDQFSKDKHIDKFLSEALGDNINDPFAKQVVYATDINIPSVANLIMESCGTVSMFAPEQAVVVRKANEMKADDTKALASWLKNAPDCKLLLDFDELKATSELYKVLQKVGTVAKYEEPKQYKMQEWISSQIPKFFGKPIEPAASQYLADALGTDTKLVCEEVEKVLLFAPDCKKITLDLVRTMIVPQREMVSYEINDSFGMRDVKQYARMLNELLNNGVNAIQIAGSLYRYAVDLLNLITLLDKGMTPKDAAAALGKNDYIFNVKGRAPECARRWGKPLLCRVIRRLADLDYEFKSGLCNTRIIRKSC